MACWKTRPRVHVAGVPLSSVEADCRLRRSFRLRRCGCGKEAQLVLFPGFGERTSLSPWCTVPRLRLVWKRGGSPLAPVVGEGQVNLVYGRRL